MANFTIKLEGHSYLGNRLKEMDSARFDAVVKKNLVDMFNRGKEIDPLTGGTPVDTGELRKSLSVNLSGGVVGYIAEYAAHVNFGHRTKNGGYVKGQHFLDKNVQIQEPIYHQDLLKAVRGK